MATKTESPNPHHESPSSSQAEHTSPRKRRKVNHACIYCRRSHMTCDLERPCARCVKRSIGHLCHDEPRESNKAAKPENDRAPGPTAPAQKQDGLSPGLLAPSFDQQRQDQQLMQDARSNMALNSPSRAIQDEISRSLQPTSNPVSAQGFGNNSQFLGYGDWRLGSHNQFQDMHNYHPSYMFNAPDITSEYNLLNEFLSTNLLDDGTLFCGDDAQGLNTDFSLTNTLAASTNSTGGQLTPQQPDQTLGAPSSLVPRESAPRSKPARPSDKEEEKYYMNIADPSGNDTPEERMNKLLKAKYTAGMLRPFNYIQGYARLNQYIEKNMQPASRQRILRQLDKFRPKFRERMQSLTDMQLTMVEMWFERTLMEYDRVFASMAIPACCWRRTGEIFRGNKAMAELIHVPIEKLRDGKLALHEIIAEKDLVSYWDNFLAIAFDNSQKAMLTSCSLKNPDPKALDVEMKCCFSFTIRRDTQHNIPSMIVGNFLPQIARQR